MSSILCVVHRKREFSVTVKQLNKTQILALEYTVAPMTQEFAMKG